MKTKRLFNKIMSLLLTAILVISAIPLVNTTASAASVYCVLPLPENQSYNVTVLSQYSSGAKHASYLTKYVLKTGAYSQPDCLMDIAAKSGTKVCAVADGTVYQNNKHTNGGYNVVIKHLDGSYSYYGHLQKRSALKVGDTVSAGQLVGYVGMSGNATGYHLHFEWTGHDPFCEFNEMGYKLNIKSDSGASKYPHSHIKTSYVSGTSGALPMYLTAGEIFEIASIPEGAAVTVDVSKARGQWLFVTYNKLSGYCKAKYITDTKPSSTTSTTTVGSTTSNGISFPLPTTKSYSVSVLSKYSSGSIHPSYVSQYILSQGAGGNPNILMDIAASEGTPVYAVADGVVYQNNNHKNGGYNVVIKHNDGTYSYYGHLLSRSTLEKGAKVTCGQKIGEVGMSGSATGYHLHFEWSGHDPYCEFKAMGFPISIMSNSGASVYPHSHNSSSSVTSQSLSTYTAYVTGTDGSLAINSRASSGYRIGTIPEGAACTVDPNKTSGSWLYVTYNGVSGYSYYKYLTRNKPAAEPETKPEPEYTAPIENTYTAYVINTDGALAINSRASSGYMISSIPEGEPCTVYPDKSDGKWLYVTYNGVSGYSYSNYLTTTAPATRIGVISGTDGSLAINSIASSGYRIGIIPEGASCVVYTEKTVGNWVWVRYNGISGYSYSKYIK